MSDDDAQLFTCGTKHSEFDLGDTRWHLEQAAVADGGASRQGWRRAAPGAQITAATAGMVLIYSPRRSGGAAD